MSDMEHKLPIGTFKQSVMKLDSFMSDIHEIHEEVDLDPGDRETLTQMCEMAGVMQAALVNIVRKEMDEEEFLSENIDMDEIDVYPGSFEESEDILDAEIE